MSSAPLVAIRGGGDLGSACALRLVRIGLHVVVAEQAMPTVVRRTVAFAEAVYAGRCRVEEVEGRLVDDAAHLPGDWQAGRAPVLVDPSFERCLALQPAIVVDARMAKRNMGTHRHMARGVVGLGPGFSAGLDVDAVVETNRGPHLGRVIWDGAAEPNTGRPGAVDGHTCDRVLRAPAAGTVENARHIGDVVDAGDVVATVGDHPVRAPFQGVVRGLIHPGTRVAGTMKIGDLDPRLDPSLCFFVSDKGLAVAGGVMEAALMLLRRRGFASCLTEESAHSHHD